MSSIEVSVGHTVIVETQVQFSLQELSRVCGVDVVLIESLVHEGVLTPQGHSLGDSPAQWYFEGTVLPRARKATRLLQDLELSTPGAALVLDLFDEIEALKSQLRRLRG